MMKREIPIQSPVPLTEAELKVFKLGWLECLAAHRDAQDQQVNQQMLEALILCRTMVGHPDNIAIIDAAISAAEAKGGV